MISRSFGSRARRFAVLLCVFVLTLAPILPKVASASSMTECAAPVGTLTVSPSVADEYEAYQLFDAKVADGDSSGEKLAIDVAWTSDAARDAALPVLREAGMDGAKTVAQDAAEWIGADGRMTPSLALELARALRASGVEPRAIFAGSSEELPAGYWLVVADDDAIGESQAGTAPIFALLGGAPVTVVPKAAVPEVRKNVLEDSDGVWRKAADATVGDDLYWRFCATIPAGLVGYEAYTVEFSDAMSAGVDSSKVVSSARVYLAAGIDGGFNAVCVDGGSVGCEPADGWKDITAGCSVSVDARANTFTLRTGDLISEFDSSESFGDGARLVVVYNAPLGTKANRGVALGNPNEVFLRYPRSPFADQGGENGYTCTPSDNATAYTWDLSLIKRSSDDRMPLSGAVLRVADDRGRQLTADGMWSRGDATVATGADGCVTISGVDSGTLMVEEVAAPEGFVGFAGARALTLAIEGLDVQQVAAAKPTFTVSVEDPLLVDGVDAGSGVIESTVLNSPKPTTPSEWFGGLFPKTGDRCLTFAFMLMAAGILLMAGLRFLGRGESRRGE